MSLGVTRIRGPRHLDALDGIRGLAALAVVVTHVGFESGVSFRGALGALAARAEIGVAVFFVLSGFLLYRPFARHHAGLTPAPSVRRYLWHRLLRIWPAYLLALAAVLIVHHRDDATFRTIVSNALLMQTYGQDLLLPELAQSWTLSTEVAWYLFLPVLAMVLLRRPAQRPPSRHMAVQLAACGILLVGSTAYAVTFRTAGLLDAFISGYWLPHYLGWFGLGMALAVLHVGVPGTRRSGWLTELGDAPLSCLGLATALYLIVCTPVAGPRGLTGLTAWEGVAREGLYAAVATLIVLPAAFGDPTRSIVLAGLGSRPGRYLGEISYALFLWHFPLLPLAFALTGTAEFEGRFWLNLIVLLAIALPTAALSWHLVEKPALRAKDWGPGRPRTPKPRPHPSSADDTAASTQAATATATRS